MKNILFTIHPSIFVILVRTSNVKRIILVVSRQEKSKHLPSGDYIQIATMHELKKPAFAMDFRWR